MGGACARCNEVKKGKADVAPAMHPHLAESESDAGGDDHSEVAASSDEGGDEEGYKQGVEEILKSTGKNLKRGKTMAMREAISTAKKYGLETSTITEAEQQLIEHKKQQRREEVEKEVEAFFASASSRDIALTEKMAKRATEADCRAEVISKLSGWLDELIQTRPLEVEEDDLARSYLKQSCRDFVLAATRGGRQVVMLDLDAGRKLPARITLDPPLQHLRVAPDSQDARVNAKEVPISKLSAGRAKDDKAVAKRRGFSSLEDEDIECAVYVRYEEHDRSTGVFCFVEPTLLRRDRLIEAILVLTVACT